MEDSNGKVIEGLDIFDISADMLKKTKVQQAKMLSEIELYVPVGTKLHDALRKIVLNNTNDLAREVLKTIFGTDFEGMIK